MAIPALPSVTSIVTQALRRGGRTSPSAAQITEGIEHFIQEVKSDIMLAAATHPLLLVTATTVTRRGQQRYQVPDDFNIFASMTLLDSSDTYRGTVQSAADTFIVLSASSNHTADEIVGKYILITSGAGVEEYRQIIAYVPETFTATVDLAWLTSPTSTSTYLIVTNHFPLGSIDTATEFDLITQPSVLGLPKKSASFGQEFLLYPVPDKSTYGIALRYFADLSMLDETGDLFIQLLREWRNIWIQGIAVKTMDRYDEDRYNSALQIYGGMIELLTSQSCQVTQIRQAP